MPVRLGQEVEVTTRFGSFTGRLVAVEVRPDDTILEVETESAQYRVSLPRGDE